MASSPRPEAATRWRPPLDDDALRTVRRARALRRRRRAQQLLTRTRI